MQEDATNLFDRVPERIFRPLGIIDHARRYWELLVHLYGDFFAPEAEPPEGEGWTQKQIVASIERFLLRYDDQHGLDEGERATPTNIRAHGMLKALVEAEWLTMQRSGFMQFVIMRPTVQSLFELLKTFAEQGPEFISGRVQSIRNNLEQVRAGPEANASVFQLAAKECSALLRMLNTTRMRVREASEELRRKEVPRQFLQQFFGDYISRLYIGDYHDLFARHHPLSSRWAIIELAVAITETPEVHSYLVSWYRKNFRTRDVSEAEQLIESDLHKIMALRDVDTLLGRLKDAVTRANDEAIGYLEYRIRAQGNFGLQVQQAISTVTRAAASRPDEAIAFPLGWSTGRMFTEQSLRPPQIKPAAPQDLAIKKRELSPEAQARRLVRQIMKGNRQVSEAIVLRYIDRHLPEDGFIESSSMTIESINDLCVLASFSRIAIQAERAEHNMKNGLRRIQHFRELVKHVRIEPIGERFSNEYLSAPAVRITRIKRA